MIFLQLKTEKLVQVGDKTRLDISKTFISGNLINIDKFEIKPTATADFMDVTNEMFLDWIYDSEGLHVIEVRATDESLVEYTKLGEIEIISKDGDNLFSTDDDILPLEPDLLRWVQDGRNSFLDKHRAAQTEILGELDAARIWKDDGTKYTNTDKFDLTDFRDWSKFVTLRIIFSGIHNDVDDVFKAKASGFQKQAVQAKNRATFRLDKNNDGKIETTEIENNDSGFVVRR